MMLKKAFAAFRRPSQSDDLTFPELLRVKAFQSDLQPAVNVRELLGPEHAAAELRDLRPTTWLRHKQSGGIFDQDPFFVLLISTALMPSQAVDVIDYPML